MPVKIGINSPKVSDPLNRRYKEAILQRMEGGTSAAAQLTEARIKQVDTKRMQDELYLAKAREELIPKALVEKQAAYLLVSLRQRILAVPSTYARRMLGLTDAKQSAALLREMALSLLNEIKGLPEKVVDPNWLEVLEEKGGDKANGKKL